MMNWLIVELEGSNRKRHYELVREKNLLGAGELHTGKAVTVCRDQNKTQKGSIVMVSDDRRFLEQQLHVLEEHARRSQAATSTDKAAGRYKEEASGDFSPSGSSWDPETNSSSDSEERTRKQRKKAITREYKPSARKPRLPSLRPEPVIPVTWNTPVQCSSSSSNVRLVDYLPAYKSLNENPSPQPSTPVPQPDSSKQCTSSVMTFDQQSQTDSSGYDDAHNTRVALSAIRGEMIRMGQTIADLNTTFQNMQSVLNLINVDSDFRGWGNNNHLVQVPDKYMQTASAEEIKSFEHSAVQVQGMQNVHINVSGYLTQHGNQSVAEYAQQEGYQNLRPSRSPQTNHVATTGVIIQNEINQQNVVDTPVEAPVKKNKLKRKYIKNIQEQQNGDEFSDQLENGDMVRIGSGQTLVPRHVLTKINWNSYTIATRKLLMAVFPRRTLATHSLTGKSSPAFTNKPAKVSLDPRKVSDIITTVIENSGVKESLVRSAITTKCADENKMYRMRQEKRGRRAKKLVIKTPPQIESSNQENIPPEAANNLVEEPNNSSNGPSRFSL